MFSLRHLKAMVLIVGLLTIGLGLYVGFQVQDAAAHGAHVRISGEIRYFTRESTVWTFYSYNGGSCPNGSGGSVKIEEEWKIYTRYKQVRVYYHHENGNTHWRNVSTRAVSRRTVRMNSYRYICSVHGLSCPGLNGG